MKASSIGPYTDTEVAVENNLIDHVRDSTTDRICVMCHRCIDPTCCPPAPDDACTRGR